jgi:DNA (cytosine-5)-methyltransferase 1
MFVITRGGNIVPYAIDLFCGAGGMSEGIIQAGFHILFSSDINVDVERTYTNRHEQLGLIQDINTCFHRDDIRNLTGDFITECIQGLQIFRNGEVPLPEDIDAIFGGPPCQGFSRAGRRDSNDPRNLLFREYLRVINEIRPKYVIMENVEGFTDTRLDNFVGVTGITYPDETLVPDILLQEFANIDYNTLEPRILDSSNYGVPQRRKRVIFIAYRNDVVAPRYPEPTHTNENKITLLAAIGDLIADNHLRQELNPILTRYQLDSRNGRTLRVDNEAIEHNGVFYNYEFSNHSPIIVERFSLFNEGEDSAAIKRRIIREGIDITGKAHLLAELNKKFHMTEQELINIFANAQATPEMIEVLLTKKTARTKLNSHEPSLTVLTLPDDYISPFEDRIFSVREMARLQSFDDSFQFLGKRTTGGIRRKIEVPQYSQVGNAVPPLMAKAVACEIMNAIIETSRRFDIEPEVAIETEAAY